MSPLTELITGAKAYGWGSLSLSSAFEWIATASVGSSTPNVSFTAIPSSYTHLQIRWAAKTTSGSAAYIAFQFNDDTGTNYSSRGFWNGNSVGNSFSAQTGVSSIGHGRIPPGSNRSPGVGDAEILEYSSTTKRKILRAVSGGYNPDGPGFFSGMWNNTSAITKITISMSNGNIEPGSLFYLYGIKGS